MIDGSTADFDVWVAPHLDELWLLARRWAGQDAADVVQEALLQAWRNWDRFDPSRGTERTWLLMLVADRCRRHHRRRRPMAAVAASDEAVYDVQPDLDLRAAIARLPHRQRMAVELHYVMDLPIAEVAAVMRCASGTVKSTLSDARSRLRTLLEGDQ